MTSDIDTISQRRADWTTAMQAGEIEQYLALLTDDVVWIPPRGSAVHGKEQIQEWLTPLFQQFSYDVTFSTIQVSVAGDWTIEQGTFTTRLVPRIGGDAMEHQSRYLVLWRRGANANWSIERYVDLSRVG